MTVLVVFGQVGNHQFLHFDDNEYIYENDHVRTGLSSQNITWAFTAYHSNNWHPLTWISHMLDSQLFGVRPGPHHLMNVVLHALNVVVLFLLLRSLTGAVWRSAFVAALFAVNPLRVESIAWASERKDVLSALFGLLTIGLYAAYAKRPSLARYVAVAVTFAAGLMAKPMLVTLPFVLLLLDFWPLRRLGGSGGNRDTLPAPKLPWLEKLPLVALAAASSALTLAAQSRGGVVQTLEEIPAGMRVANALVSFVRYGLKLLFPVQQAFYYPYPREVPVLPAAGALVLLAAITVCVVRIRHDKSYALVGWLWYLGTLIPVIGIVQVATQSIADRYTYLPSIGFFIIVAWGAADLARSRPGWRTGIAAAAGVALCAMAAKAWDQTAYWKDGITLFGRDVQVVKDNPLGYRNLGVELSDSERHVEAIAAFENVLQRYPHDPVTLYNIGSSLEKMGRLPEADKRYTESLQYKPDQPDALYNLGNVLNRLGRTDEAIARLREAIGRRPEFTPAYNNLANLLSRLGRQDEAIDLFREALRREPGYADAHNNLGTALRRAGRSQEGQEEFMRALAANPRFAAAEFNLGVVFLDQGDTAAARRHFQRAIELDPTLEKNLGGFTLSPPSRNEQP